MSIENAKAFLEKVKSDEDLRAKLSDKNLSGEERLNMAKLEGFEFTKEEMLKVRAEFSDEELHMISGGAGLLDQERCNYHCGNIDVIW